MTRRYQLTLTLKEATLESLKHINNQISDGLLDAESGHERADQVLINIFKTIGWNEIVEEYQKVPKWYS